MANKSPKAIVDEVEDALRNSTPCPYCGLYDGTHQVTCEYLKHKGDVDAERAKPTKKEEKAAEAELPSNREMNEAERKAMLSKMNVSKDKEK